MDITLTQNFHKIVDVSMPQRVAMSDSDSSNENEANDANVDSNSGDEANETNDA